MEYNKDGYPHGYPRDPPPNYGSPPGQSYPHVQEVQANTIIIQQNVPLLGPMPAVVVCPTCKTSMLTRIEKVASTKAHLFAALCCLFGCWCGCCLIPYSMDSCQLVKHFCTSCGAYIGTYQPD